MRSQAPFDQVVDQDPNPREEADEGSTVVLEVSGGPGTVRVPTVRGLPQAVAIEALDKRDLKATVDRRPSETIEKGIAIRTVPAAGEEVERGERIQLFVELRARAGGGAGRDRAVARLGREPARRGRAGGGRGGAASRRSPRTT